MMIQQVTAVAVRFVKLEKLIQQHTEKLFQYLKILKLEGHYLLTPQLFPHLFRAALLFKRKRKRTFKDYRTTRELNAEVSEQEIEEALQEPPFKKIKLAQLDHEGLKTIYGMSNADIDSVVNSGEKIKELIMSNLLQLPKSSRGLHQEWSVFYQETRLLHHEETMKVIR